MKLVVGLGNPGSRYQGTRHNVGFEVIESLAKDFGRGKGKRKFKGILTEANLGGQSALLLQPQTFMNLSGESVQLVKGFYRLPEVDVLIVCDDFNLPLGRLRFRSKGSAGGQKGLADILRRLAIDEIARLRIGVGPPPEDWDVSDFVLSRFTKAEQTKVDAVVDNACSGVVDWASKGIDFCMNQYNAA